MTTPLLKACENFNEMYRLPVAPLPSTQHLKESVSKRLEDFKATLVDEINEIDEIDLLQDEVDILTQIGDLLADICVFCHSEAVKYGLPLDLILGFVMESNESKQNPDGTTSYNEQGKVQKGVNYWKPEPKIRQLIENMRRPVEGAKKEKGERFINEFAAS